MAYVRHNEKEHKIIPRIIKLKTKKKKKLSVRKEKTTSKKGKSDGRRGKNSTKGAPERILLNLSYILVYNFGIFTFTLLI